MHPQHLRPEAKTSAKLDAHVKLFFRTFNIEGGEKIKEFLNLNFMLK